MVRKLLVAGITSEDRAFVDRLIQMGVDVKILDCFEDTHAYIHSTYPLRSIQVAANHTAVKSAVYEEGFDVAVIREDAAGDFVRTALLVQTLREARIGYVLVISDDANSVSVYRRCGAHQVIVPDGRIDVWSQIESYLDVRVTAS